MCVDKKHNLFVSAHTDTQLVQPAKPAEAMFLTPTLLMWGSAGDAGRTL